MPVCRNFLFCYFQIIVIYSSAQTIEQIHLKKEKSKFIFFQKGKVCDTIIGGKTDIFYLLLSDSIKQNFIIETENAQLTSLLNDSLVLLKYMPGIKYQNKFVKPDKEPDALYQSNRNKLIMLTLIDGASNITLKKIKLSFINQATNLPFTEFIYCAR